MRLEPGTGADTDLELTDLTAFEFDPPCECRREACSAAAEWMLLLDCGHTRLLCDPHKVMLVEQSEGPAGSFCLDCFPGPLNQLKRPHERFRIVSCERIRGGF